MAVGHHGRAGEMSTVKVVIKQDTATVTIPRPPTVDTDAVELIAKRGIALSVLLAWHSANIYAIIRTVHLGAVAILAIDHRHRIGKNAKVSINFLAEHLLSELVP